MGGHPSRLGRARGLATKRYRYTGKDRDEWDGTTDTLDGPGKRGHLAGRAFAAEDVPGEEREVREDVRNPLRGRKIFRGNLHHPLSCESRKPWTGGLGAVGKLLNYTP